MTHKPFEKQIADKLNQFEVQPGDNMLDSIFEKRAAQKKPVTALAKWFLAAAVMTVAVSALYMFNGNGKPASIASSQAPVPGKVEGNMAPAIQDDRKTIVESHSNRQEAVSSPVTTPSGSIARPAGSAKPAARRVDPAKEDRRMADRSGSRGTAPKLANTESGSGSSKGKFSGDNGEDIYNRYFDITSKNRPVIDREKHKGNSHLFVYQSVDEKELDKISEFNMPMQPIRKFANIYDVEDMEKAKNPGIHAPTLSRPHRRPLFIDLLYVPVLSSASATNNAGVQGYANSISRNSYHPQYGLRASVPVSPRISVFSGLYYQEQGNLYNGNVNKQEAFTRINTITTYINDPMKGPIKVISYDTVSGMENRQTAYNFKNSYKLFQLPLGFSYNFGFKKFDFALNTSALINLVSSSSGQYMDIQNNNTKSFASSGKYFGFGAGFGFMTAYRISPKFRLILEPGVQYFGINAIKAGNNMNEKVLNKQLTIGLRYSVF